jgi:protein-S-isoprenylcysteine O-methyltransferase Ste14
MPVETLWLRKAVVVGSALIYWAGVFIQVRRVQKRIGRSPNVRPRGSKERLLWLGWLLVILGWIGQPLFLGDSQQPFFSLISSFIHPLELILGMAMVVSGYLGTLWCYVVLGNAWRMGTRKRERTALVKHGPYQHVRHPIYLFQTIVLGGVVLLLPTPFLLFIFGIHLLCIFVKIGDEEAYLISVHGPEYRDYLCRTGRLLPRIRAVDQSRK